MRTFPQVSEWIREFEKQFPRGARFKVIEPIEVFDPVGENKIIPKGEIVEIVRRGSHEAEAHERFIEVSTRVASEGRNVRLYHKSGDTDKIRKVDR